jgi:hypothetical protein
VSGQGSHFKSAQETTGLGTTAGSDSAPAAATSTDNAQSATGPEAGGDKHVGTVDPSSTTAATEENPTSGAVGETTTYSSTPLAKGDPTSSVVDTESTDPVTYQKPEHTYTGGNETGVPEGAAVAAASKAFKSTPG